MRRLVVLILLAAALSAACARQSIDTKPAVESALRAYLAQRPGLALDNMDMEVKDVEFKGETAEADVVFRVKDGQGEIAMRYTLRRQGNQWVVEPARPPGGRSGQTGASGNPVPNSLVEPQPPKETKCAVWNGASPRPRGRRRVTAPS